jgi:single-strand DNA-binding protein
MANLNLNKVILCGRLTADVELKQTPNGLPVCTFALAINRKVAKDQPQKADFIKCVAWRQTAEFISRYFKKGSSLCVAGSIQTRTWKNDEGYARESVEVLVDEAMFVDSKSEAGNHDAPTFASQPPTAPNFENLKTDDDLPF